MIGASCHTVSHESSPKLAKGVEEQYMAFGPVISKGREQVIPGTAILLPYYLAANIPEPLFAGRHVPFTGIFHLLLGDKQGVFSR